MELSHDDVVKIVVKDVTVGNNTTEKVDTDVVVNALVNDHETVYVNEDVQVVLDPLVFEVSNADLPVEIEDDGNLVEDVFFGNYVTSHNEVSSEGVKDFSSDPIHNMIQGINGGYG